MRVEYLGSKFLSFTGNAIQKIDLKKGFNEIDDLIVKHLSNNDYFKSLLEKNHIILHGTLLEEPETSKSVEIQKPSEVVGDPVVIDKALIESVAKETLPTTKKRKPSIEFGEDP